MGAESTVPLRIVQWLVPNEQTEKYTLDGSHCPEEKRTIPSGEATLPFQDLVGDLYAT